MDARKILIDLKARKYAPVYFLHGEEPYFIDLIAGYIEANVLRDAEKGFNQVVIYGKDSPMATILTHARSTRHFVELSAHFRDLWEKPVRIVPSSSLSACLQMTIDGLGIAPLPRTLVEKALVSGELVEIPYEWKPSALVFTASFAHTPASFLLRRSAELAITP